MCCNRINTDVLLANLFAVSPRRYTETDIRSYLDFLTECFPTYVTSDYSPQRIRECVAQYPELYHATGKTALWRYPPVSSRQSCPISTTSIRRASPLTLPALQNHF